MQTWRLYALGVAARRLRRRRARLVFRRAAGRGRRGTSSGRTPTSIIASAAARSATSSPIRSSTNTAWSTSARSPAACGCFYAESLSGVINWSFAAPLFAINAVLLAALLERSLSADPRPFSAAPGAQRPGRAGGARDALGPVDGADHQHVPAPVGRPVLVQSGRRGALAGGDRRRRRPARTAIFAISA